MYTQVVNKIFIYTGYFALLKMYLKYDLFPISVSRSTPIYMKNIVKYKYLAPSNYLLFNYKNKLINEAEYEDIYNKRLEELNISQIVRDLFKLSNNKTPILLCYEKYNNFCHRYLIAKWLNTNANISCVEFL